MPRLGLGLGLGSPTVYPPTAPTASAGVTGFWRADIGASPAAWTNRLASGDFAQATGGKQPSIVSGVFGSRPGVRFDGAAQGMDGPQTGALIGASEGTVYVLCVVRSIALAAANIYQSDTIVTDAGGYWGIGLRSTTGVAAYNYDGTIDEAGQTAITLNVPHVIRWRHSGGNVYQRLDAGTETAGVASGATLATTSALRLGYGYTGANYHAAVDVGAVVTANAALTDDAMIMRWLRWYGAI